MASNQQTPLDRWRRGYGKQESAEVGADEDTGMI